MLKPQYSKKFKKDIKKFEHQKVVMAALRDIIERLLCEQLLEEKNCDHFLTGNWLGHRECHVKPDVLLNREYLFLERLGSHSDLFK